MMAQGTLPAMLQGMMAASRTMPFSGIVLLAAIIPWSIAGSVPCAIMGVGPECLPYAFYLYMVPLTDMLLRRH